MRVGLLITSIGNFGQKGFYNTQEIGLAKELNKTVDEVVVYKLVPTDQKARNEKETGSRFIGACYDGYSGHYRSCGDRPL